MKKRKKDLWQVECSTCGEIFKTAEEEEKFCSPDCSEGRIKDFVKLPIEHERPKTIVKETFLKLRFDVLRRDGFKCQYCGRNPREHGCVLHVDHIRPKARGGTNALGNLITSCLECNLGKSDSLLDARTLWKKDNASLK